MAASHAEPLASVPIVMAALPASARPRCATALSRLEPPNVVTTIVAKPPRDPDWHDGIAQESDRARTPAPKSGDAQSVSPFLASNQSEFQV